MVKPHSSRRSRKEMKRGEPKLTSLKSREKPRLKKRTLDYDPVDHFLNDILQKDLEIFVADEWLNDIPTDDYICADPDVVDHDFVEKEKKPIECSLIDEMIGLIDDPIWVDPDVLTHGSDVLGYCSDTRSVTSPEFEIWSPTPDYSGFDAAEYYLNFLTLIEEEETNINPSLPNRDEQPD